MIIGYDIISGAHSKDVEKRKRGCRGSVRHQTLIAISIFLKEVLEIDCLQFDKNPNRNDLVKKLISLGVSRHYAKSILNIDGKFLAKVFKKDPKKEGRVTISTLKSSGIHFRVYLSEYKMSDSYLNGEGGKCYINVWIDSKSSDLFKETVNAVESMATASVLINVLEKECVEVSGEANSIDIDGRGETCSSISDEPSSTRFDSRYYKNISMSIRTLSALSCLSKDKVIKTKSNMQKIFDLNIIHHKSEMEFFESREEMNEKIALYAEDGIYCERGRRNGKFYLRKVYSDIFQFGTNREFTERKVFHKSIGMTLKKVKDDKERNAVKSRFYRKGILYVNPTDHVDPVFGTNSMKTISEQSKEAREKLSFNFSKRKGGTYFDRIAIQNATKAKSFLFDGKEIPEDFIVTLDEDRHIEKVWTAEQGFETRPKETAMSFGYDGREGHLFYGSARFFREEGRLYFVNKHGEAIELDEKGEEEAGKVFGQKIDSFISVLEERVSKSEKESRNSTNKQDAAHEPAPRQYHDPRYLKEARLSAKRAENMEKVGRAVERRYGTLVAQREDGDKVFKSYFEEAFYNNMEEDLSEEDSYILLVKKLQQISRKELDRVEIGRALLMDYAPDDVLEAICLLAQKHLSSGAFSYKPSWWNECRYEAFKKRVAKEQKEKKAEREFKRREREERRRSSMFYHIREAIRKGNSPEEQADLLLSSVKKDKNLRDLSLREFLIAFSKSYKGLKEQAYKLMNLSKVVEYENVTSNRRARRTLRSSFFGKVRSTASLLINQKDGKNLNENSSELIEKLKGLTLPEIISLQEEIKNRVFNPEKKEEKEEELKVGDK